MAEVTRSGYQTILSTPWYLNRISYGQDWTGLYRADPHNFTGMDGVLTGRLETAEGDVNQGGRVSPVGLKWIV